METLWAALPLAAAMGVLLARRWPAPRAAALGCGLVLALAWLAPAYATPPGVLGAALLAGLATTLAVVSVVYGGLVLYQVMQTGGALARIAAALGGLGADRPALALVLVLGWAPFVESASGFGVAAAVTTPLLLALGFAPRPAMLLGLLGLCAVPWGALGIGTALGARLADVPLPAVGATTALLSLPLLLFYAGLAASLAGGRAAWRRWPLGLALVAMLAGTLWAVSAAGGVEVAGLAGGLATLALGGAWLLAERRPRVAVAVAMPAPRLSLVRAAMPYALLVGLLVLTRWPPLAAALTGVAVLEAPGGAARWPLLAGASPWLLLAAAIGGAALGLPPAGLARAAAVAACAWWRPALATAGFIALGQLMQATGMTAALARAMAGLGPAYLAAAAPLGGLAGYVTGSNAGANAMLAVLGAEAAAYLGLSPVLVLAMQNAAAANVTLAAPARVLLVLAVTGLAGAERAAEEAAITRRALAIAAASVLLLALVGLGVAWGSGR